MMSNNENCPNFNHKRSNAPVRFCSMCGGIVNDLVATTSCSEQKHATDRRQRNTFCVLCGDQLIDAR